MEIQGSTPTSGLLSSREAARHLGKSVHWLRTEGKRLGIPCYRVGGRYQYRVEELDEWLSTCRHRPTFYPVRSSGYVLKSKVTL